ncbi:hypothetical protein SCYAM73S_03702 [Streptomyces cyaneofuscatus]
MACRAVSRQLKLVVRLTGVTLQPLLSLLSSAKAAFPPLQLVKPLGPSTLCGSYLMAPQETVPAAHWACRLGGEDM